MKFTRTLVAVLAVTAIATPHLFASVAVPEIDPSMGVGTLALLGGAIMVIRGRVKS